MDFKKLAVGTLVSATMFAGAVSSPAGAEAGRVTIDNFGRFQTRPWAARLTIGRLKR